LKKQKAKKAGGGKKKDKTEAAAEASTEAPGEAEAEPEASNTSAEAEEKPEEAAPEATEEVMPASPSAVDDDEPSELPSKSAHGRKPSMAVESRQRSESFYRAGGPTSPTGLTPAGGVSSEIYREQVQRIEELEKENSRLTGEVDEYKGKWSKGEEELEEFREGRGDVALAIEKGKQADKLVWDRTSEFALARS
jgi:hypothetical protein